MARMLKIAAAQLGPLHRADSRSKAVSRLVQLLKDAHGMGAKFVFPRTLNNELFVNEQSGFLRFYSEMAKSIKLNMRFKIADMMYEGKLEY